MSHAFFPFFLYNNLSMLLNPIREKNDEPSQR
jgi:hypothetical protein